MLRILKMLDDIFVVVTFAEVGEFFEVNKEEPGFDTRDANQALSDGWDDGVAG